MFYMKFSISYDIFVQNRIIDDIFTIGDSSSVSDIDVEHDISGLSSSIDDVSDYLGYISIPSFGIKRLIKNGTDESVLNGNFVGLYGSNNLDSDDLIILAGHNVSNVFSKLHFISVDDVVYVNSYNFQREFVVYDKRIVDEGDTFYLSSDRSHELLLITCTKSSGKRLLVFLKEVLWIF